MTKYLDELNVKGLINENLVEDGRFYTITAAGLGFVNEVRKAEAFVAGFGLNI